MEGIFLKRFELEGSLAYLLGSLESKKAILIDPVHQVEDYLQVIEEQGLELVYLIDTHSHADHVSTAGELKAATGAQIAMHSKVREQRELSKGKGKEIGIEDILEKNGEIEVDIYVEDGQILELGKIPIEFIYTPGHTSDCMVVSVAGRLFTGDTLLIGQCGRTDLPGGSSKAMYKTITEKILNLSDELLVYPGHDYKGNINSTVGYERVNNPFLTKASQEEFLKFTSQFFPPLKVGEGGNLHCGITGPDVQKDAVGEEGAKLSPTMNKMCLAMEGYLNNYSNQWNIITADELAGKIEQRESLFILDVREPTELKGGYIPGAVNIPLQQLPQRVKEIQMDREYSIITVCRSGVRSAYAALFLRGYGFSSVRSLEMGMLDWQKKGYPVTFN